MQRKELLHIALNPEKNTHAKVSVLSGPATFPALHTCAFTHTCCTGTLIQYTGHLRQLAEGCWEPQFTEITGKLRELLF